MRQYHLPIGAYISNGLRPDDRNPRNNPFLTQMQNVRPVKVGEAITGSTFTPVVDPFASGYLAAAGVSISHPFPMIFKGKEITLLADETGLYEVTEGVNWTLSKYTTFDGYDKSTPTDITAGGSWHFADMGDSWALFNGSCVVFKTGLSTMFGGTTNPLVIDDITIQTGCFTRGRLVMGGFNSSNFYHKDWATFLSSVTDPIIGIATPPAPDTNWIWWSQIGSDAFFLFYPDETLYGLLDIEGKDIFTIRRNRMWEIIERNEMGFTPMNWQGTVRCVKPLGNGFMVYGDNGITFMPKVGSTYGVKDVLGYGIESRSAVGGTEKEHIFIDEAGWLWMANAEGNLTKLGYREFFEQMQGNDIVISYDPIEDEYHISDSALCFTLTRDKRLYESTYLLTSTATSLGDTVGVYARPGNADDDYAIVATDAIDLNMRADKSIDNVIVTATNTTTMSVAIDWRRKTSDSWSRTAFQNTNYEGVAFFPVRGLEFRIVVRTADYTKLSIDDITILYETGDNRWVRGTYALSNPSRG